MVRERLCKLAKIVASYGCRSGECWASIETLAMKFGKSRRQTARYLGMLSEGFRDDPLHREGLEIVEKRGLRHEHGPCIRVFHASALRPPQCGISTKRECGTSAKRECGTGIYLKRSSVDKTIPEPAVGLGAGKVCKIQTSEEKPSFEEERKERSSSNPKPSQAQSTQEVEKKPTIRQPSQVLETEKSARRAADFPAFGAEFFRLTDIPALRWKKDKDLYAQCFVVFGEAGVFEQLATWIKSMGGKRGLHGWVIASRKFLEHCVKQISQYEEARRREAREREERKKEREEKQKKEREREMERLRRIRMIEKWQAKNPGKNPDVTLKDFADFDQFYRAFKQREAELDEIMERDALEGLEALG